MHPHIDNTSAYAVSAFIVVALLFDLRNDVRNLIRGRNVVLVSIFCWFLLEAVNLSPVLNTFSQATFNLAIFYVFIAAAAFLAGYHLTAGCRFTDPLAAQFRCLDNPRVLWLVVAICAVIGFAPVAVYSGMELQRLFSSMMSMRKGWGGLLSRGRYGDFRAAMLQLEYFIRGASPFAFILLLDRRSTFSQKLVCALVTFWPVVRAYGSGTRSALMVAVLPLLAVIYYRCTPHWQKLLIYCGIASTPFVYFLMAAIVASRNSGQLDLSKGSNVTYVGNEMLQELAYVIDTVPERCDYQLGYSYYVQIVNPIPRFIWPDKPAIDSGLLMAQLKGEVNKTGEAYLTSSPGLLGEMYLNFGGWGIVALSFFGGWLVRGWDRIPFLHGNSLPTMILYCCGLAILFVIGRSFNATAFYAIMFLYIGLLVVTKFILPAPRQHAAAYPTRVDPRIQR